MEWKIDTSHSQIEFSVKHMAISTVRGKFRAFDATVETTEQGQLRSLHATIDARTIDTNMEQRDAHLRSADFFDTDNFPTITFRSTQVEKRGRDGYRVTGDLSMRGVTRPATFDVEVAPQVKDPWGNTRVAAEAHGTVNRKEWGLNWNQALEMGGVLVSEQVKFNIEVQAVAQKLAAVA
jgi:polyisoprenoid-binding protein YceI